MSLVTGGHVKAWGLELQTNVPPDEVATRSWNVLERALGAQSRAELTVSTIAPGAGAVLLGRFQRSVDARGFHPELPRLRRGSGGTHLHLGEGDVHLLLALTTADALVPCTPASLVNRYVRPVLRAVGGAYFGRDWIAGPREIDRRPIAFAGFAHHAASGRAALEVLIPARDTWCDPSRASHRGLAPAHLAEPARLVAAIVSAFETAYGASTPFTSDPGDPAPPADEVAWATSIDEGMGPVRAGRDARGVLQVGGEIFASVDRLEALGPAVSADLDGDAVGALVDTALTQDGGVIVGVADLANVRDVLSEARLQHAGPGVDVP